MPMNSGRENMYRERTKDWKSQQQTLGEKRALLQGPGSEDYFQETILSSLHISYDRFLSYITESIALKTNFHTYFICL